MAGRRVGEFTTGEVARLVGTSRATVGRAIRRGLVRARRTAGGWYVLSREEVLHFLWELSFARTAAPRVRKAAARVYARMIAAPRSRPRRRR
jgi:excisionase family DNA binding protein